MICWLFLFTGVAVGGGYSQIIPLEEVCLSSSSSLKAYLIKWNMNIFQHIDPRSAFSLQARMSLSLLPVEWWWTLLKHMLTMRPSFLRRSGLCLICVCLYSCVCTACIWYDHACILQALFDLLVPLREGQRSVSPAQLSRLKVSHRKHSLQSNINFKTTAEVWWHGHCVLYDL